MDSKFTQNQQNAALHGAPQHGDTPNQRHNVLVSASAGSGKTTVLVQRILEQIIAGGEINRLLVVTFTNAAAAEMKEKIGKKLKSYLTEHRTEMDDTTRRHLTQQVTLTDSATISTLDAFALQIVQQYYYVANLDPSFRILADQTEGDMIKEAVWDEVREQNYQVELDNPDGPQLFSALTKNYASGWHDDNLGEIVFQLYNRAQTMKDSATWIQHLPDAYIPDISAEGRLTQHLAQTVTPFITAAIKNVRLAQTIIDADDPVQEKWVDNLADQLAKLTQLQQSLGADYDAMQQAVHDVTTLKTWTTTRGAKYDGLREQIAAAQALRNEAKDIITTQVVPFFVVSADDLLAILPQAHALITKLAEVTTEFKTAYWSEKQRRHVMDFGDIEQSALSILTTVNPDTGKTVAGVFRASFDEIMIDEYQDTNPLQEALMDAIAQEQPGNRFMVGDVKQSIYGFRLADPTLFMDKYAHYTEDTQDDAALSKLGEHITLADNFRSTRNIIDFTNLIFTQVMDEQLGGLEYAAAEKLQFGAKYYPDSEPAAPQAQTEVLIYTPGGDNPRSNDAEQENEAENMSNLDKDQGQIQIVINRIQELMRTPVEQIYDRNTESMRPLEYRDITLLAPTRSQNLLIQEAFADAGVPIVVNDAKNYFKTTELQVMLSLLRVIDNPLQEIPLVAVLRSPVVGMTADELAVVRLTNQDSAYYDAFKQFLTTYDASTASALSSRTYAKAARFNERLQTFRNTARENRLVDLIWEVYETTGYLDFVGGMPGGKQRQANLHALYERAHSYEENGFKGLFAFIHFIELMQKHDKDLDIPVVLETDVNAVRLMTIHGSKGLEFPIVFLLNTGRDYTKGGKNDNQIILSGAGIGIRFIDDARRLRLPLPQYELGLADKKAARIAEQMRLLYVALTRAQQKLFIIGHGTTAAKVVAGWRNAAGVSSDLVLPFASRLETKSFMNLMGAALSRHPQFGDNQLDPEFVSAALTNDQTQFSVNFVKSPPVTSRAGVVVPVTAPTSNLGADELRAWFNQPYQHQTATTTTGFQSVSEIKRLFDDPDTQTNHEARRLIETHRYVKPLVAPQFITRTDVSDDTSATAVGTATHQVLQSLKLDGSLDFQTVEAVIADLKERELITAPVAAAINREHILRFFTTTLGQRLIANAHQVQREVPFSMLQPATVVFPELAGEGEHQPVLVHGIMDGFLADGDDLILFDYKTDHIKGGTEQAIVDRYAGQLRLYAQALGKMQGRVVTHAFLILLETGHVMSVQLPQ